ncbi:endopeptidase La [Deltaproteobacteria bacterium OttesenSCG-928-M10]|nr:endopeptidase La [Deltaproteobacteria bacterium OttesenSCG-928-M10]
MTSNEYDSKDINMVEEERAGELVPKMDVNKTGLPQQMNLLPMVDLNIFPQLVYPISVEEPKGKLAVHRSLDAGSILALFSVKDAEMDPEHLSETDFHPIGMAVLVHKIWETENGHLKVVAQGLSRIKMIALRGEANSRVMVETIPEDPGNVEELRPLVLEVKRLFSQVAEMSPNMPFNPAQFNGSLEEKPGLMADLMVAALPLKRSVKAEFLATVDIRDRLMKLLEHLTVESANLETGRAIAARMKENMDKHHREVHLREQLKAIEAELGEETGESDELEELAARLSAKELPDEARETAERELNRLKKTSSHSSEYGVIRNYLEWILDLPWLEGTEDKYDLALAREVLERDHYGLEKVKKRIVEFLAVRKLTGGVKSPILCLVGPPGVGKTSLGRSVAESLGREFVRLSLGGVRDEAEIRGHRRTYVGALPGRLISGLKKAKSNNPVFLLDELDKMTRSAMGDPAAALLEVLDPEQNDTFSDHYLEIPFDLSRVLFILTANVLENIPGPLRDRLEVVELSGYTLEEKLEIAKRHLLPKELARHGLTAEDLVFSPEALTELVESYTREAGCRDLSRRLGAVARSAAVEKAEGREDRQHISSGELTAILGPPRHVKELKAAEPQKGVVTGLAWTAAGGDILFIEAVAMPGKGGLSLTGQLGEVMQESARAAVSYVRSRAFEWDIDPDWFKNNDLHVHLPQGAIPKDGPSAGVTLTTALVSLARGKKVRPDVAMTGEISLRGLVLPVGGIKEKLLAAKRAGLTRVMIPEKNQPDLAEMPPQLLEGLEVTPVKTIDEVLAVALIDEEEVDRHDDGRPEENLDQACIAAGSLSRCGGGAPCNSAC